MYWKLHSNYHCKVHSFLQCVQIPAGQDNALQWRIPAGLGSELFSDCNSVPLHKKCGSPRSPVILYCGNQGSQQECLKTEAVAEGSAGMNSLNILIYWEIKKAFLNKTQHRKGLVNIFLKRKLSYLKSSLQHGWVCTLVQLDPQIQSLPIYTNTSAQSYSTNVNSGCVYMRC